MPAAGLYQTSIQSQMAIFGSAWVLKRRRRLVLTSSEYAPSGTRRKEGRAMDDIEPLLGASARENISSAQVDGNLVSIGET